MSSRKNELKIATYFLINFFHDLHLRVFLRLCFYFWVLLEGRVKEKKKKKKRGLVRITECVLLRGRNNHQAKIHRSVYANWPHFLCLLMVSSAEFIVFWQRLWFPKCLANKQKIYFFYILFYFTLLKQFSLEGKKSTVMYCYAKDLIMD